MDWFKYREQMRQCPYYLFVQNPTSHEGMGSWTCTHASPNIGEIILDTKHCIHGKVKTESSAFTCRIITSILRGSKNESYEQETLE